MIKKLLDRFNSWIGISEVKPSELEDRTIESYVQNGKKLEKTMESQNSLRTYLKPAYAILSQDN